MTCTNCGAVLRVKNRSKSESEELCAPCESKSFEPDECPLCGSQELCACEIDDKPGHDPERESWEEDDTHAYELEAMRLAGAHFARECQCEEPVTFETGDGIQCLCGCWV